MKQLVIIEEDVLEAMTKENIVSQETIQPVERLFSEEGMIELSEQIIQKVKDGWESGAKMHALGKFLQGLGKLVSDGTIDEAISEIEQEGKEANIFGVKYSIRNLPDQLDFESDIEFKKLNDSVKERKSQLTRAFKSKETLIDESGEQIPKVPIKKLGGITVSVSFKK